MESGMEDWEISNFTPFALINTINIGPESVDALCTCTQHVVMMGSVIVWNQMIKMPVYLRIAKRHALHP